MTFLTRHLLMLAGERKLGLVVIHLGRFPAFRRMAHLAVCVPARMIRRRRLVARFALGRRAAIFATRMALGAIGCCVFAHQERKVGMSLVAAFAFVERHDLGLVLGSVGVDDAAVAIRAQHLLLQMDGVIGGAALIADGGRIRMTSDTLSVLDPDEDADGEWIVAAKVRDHLLGPAHFFLDEPRDARLGVAVQAFGAGGVLRGLPRLVIEIHLVARVAKPGLAVDVLEASAAGGKQDKPDRENGKKPHPTALSHHWCTLIMRMYWVVLAAEGSASIPRADLA